MQEQSSRRTEAVGWAKSLGLREGAEWALGCELVLTLCNRLNPTRIRRSDNPPFNFLPSTHCRRFELSTVSVTAMAGSTANLRHRSSLRWWRKWARKDWAIATVAFSVILVLFLTLISNSSDSGVTNPFHPISSADLVDLTLLHDAERRGALCLDGSAPGYHFRKGFGSGADNWLLHIEGGGWCNTMKSCSLRKWTPLGSSKYMDHRVPFSGILSSHPSENPDFFNWNKVKIRYCDGASFAGHPENEPKNGSKLFFRGQLIWEALMDEFSSIGLSKAKQALLSGCSAGGLATLIHCDNFRGLLPKDSTVKCLADAGKMLTKTGP